MMAGGKLRTQTGNKVLYQKLFLRLILEIFELVCATMLLACPLFLNSGTLTNVHVKGDSM